MFRIQSREKRMFTPPTGDTGSVTRLQGRNLKPCLPPIEEHPDIARLDQRQEKVLFNVPGSRLLR